MDQPSNPIEASAIVHADPAVRPDGYVAPRNAKELLERYAAGERYFEGTVLAAPYFKSNGPLGTHLGSINLSKSDLPLANFSNCSLWNARFDNTNLMNANFTECSIVGVRFVQANLQGANFKSACVNACDFRDANLLTTKMENTELYGIKNFVPNWTYVRNARFSSDASDPWSVLRRTYTGSNFAIHLLFLIVFLMPYFGRTLFWLGVNRTQVVFSEAASQMQALGDELQIRPEIEMRRLGQMLSNLGSTQPCLAATCEQRAVWQLLFTNDLGRSYSLLGIALLLYNIGRGVLTLRVSPLRDEEERSGSTPSWLEYRLLVYLHKMTWLLGYVAIASFLVHSWVWLTTTVWLPTSGN